MSHFALQELKNDDRDAAFAATRASTSSWPRGVFEDRQAFDRWVGTEGVVVHTIVQDAVIVGVAAAMDREGDREILLAVTPEAGDDAATEALRLLTTHEPERPLYACVAAEDEPSHAMLARIGFVEDRRHADDVVYVLPPTLE